MDRDTASDGGVRVRHAMSLVFPQGIARMTAAVAGHTVITCRRLVLTVAMEVEHEKEQRRTT